MTELTSTTYPQTSHSSDAYCFSTARTVDQSDKIAPWKVTIAMIAFCGSFWGAVAFGVSKLLG